MSTRRLGGVAVLAVAVLVLSVGTALGRPDVVGVASPPPIDPPPETGDCLYAGTADWSSFRSLTDDGSGAEYAFGIRFDRCEGAWAAEVVGVLTGDQDATAEDARNGGAREPCTDEASRFLGRPDFAAADSLWIAQDPGVALIAPDRRQQAAGQRWEACVMFAPAWGLDGDAVATDNRSGLGSTTATLRQGWTDPAVRARIGACGSGPSAFGEDLTFCGRPHDREYLAFAFWDPLTDTARLAVSCREQAARMMQRNDPTAGGALTLEVAVRSPSDDEVVMLGPGTTVPDQGFGLCRIRPADPEQQLVGSVVGIRETPPTVVTRR